MNNHTRGLLIAIEGIDRSGKSTQCKLVAAELAKAGIHVELLSYPVRESQTGIIIDKYLKGEISLSPQEAHELFAKNRVEQKEIIRHKLLEGISLIVDRYSYSGIVYSAAKGLPWGECVTSELGLVAPDLVFLLHLSPEEAASRNEYGAEIFETVPFQTKVHDAYQRLSHASKSWMIINANENKAQITDKLVTNILSARANVSKDISVFTAASFGLK